MLLCKPGNLFNVVTPTVSCHCEQRARRHRRLNVLMFWVPNALLWFSRVSLTLYSYLLDADLRFTDAKAKNEQSKQTKEFVCYSWVASAKGCLVFLVLWIRYFFFVFLTWNKTMCLHLWSLLCEAVLRLSSALYEGIIGAKILSTCDSPKNRKKKNSHTFHNVSCR